MALDLIGSGESSPVAGIGPATPESGGPLAGVRIAASDATALNGFYRRTQTTPQDAYLRLGGANITYIDDGDDIWWSLKDESGVELFRHYVLGADIGTTTLIDNAEFLPSHVSAMGSCHAFVSPPLTPSIVPEVDLAAGNIPDPPPGIIPGHISSVPQPPPVLIPQ